MHETRWKRKREENDNMINKKQKEIKVSERSKVNKGKNRLKSDSQ